MVVHDPWHWLLLIGGSLESPKWLLMAFCPKILGDNMTLPNNSFPQKWMQLVRWGQLNLRWWDTKTLDVNPHSYTQQECIPVGCVPTACWSSVFWQGMHPCCSKGCIQEGASGGGGASRGCLQGYIQARASRELHWGYIQGGACRVIHPGCSKEVYPGEDCIKGGAFRGYIRGWACIQGVIHAAAGGASRRRGACKGSVHPGVGCIWVCIQGMHLGVHPCCSREGAHPGCTLPHVDRCL